MNFLKSRFAILIAITIVLAVPLYVAWQSLYADIATNMRETTSRELDLLTKLFVQEAETSKGSVDALLQDFAESGARVTFIAEDGVVLFDSALTEEELLALDNHATREEVLKAKNFGTSTSSRYSNTLGSDLVYAASQISASQAYPAGTLRIAMPLGEMMVEISELANTFFIVIGIFLVSSALLNYYLYRRFIVSLSQVQRVVEHVALPGSKEKLALPQKEEFLELAYAVSAMSERVDEQIQINASQSSELESIFNTLQAGVMVLDSRGYIIKLNAAFSTLLPDYFTKDLASYQGKRVLGVLNDSEVAEKIHNMYQSELTFETMEIQLSGHVFQLSMVKPENHEGIQIEAELVLLFHDITHLSQLIQIKRDLVANVSHELRTPLTAIQGYTETLQSLFAEPELPKKQIEHFLETIIKNTRHLDRVVSDLLSLSSVENSSFEIKDNVHTTLGNACEVALEECKALLNSKNIVVENNLVQEISLSIDQDRLSQVFRNLLENAIRYSSEGNTIVLYSELNQVDGNGQSKEECIIYVQDYGSGIPQQELTRVFERFYRVEKHRSDALSTGLGLSICKHIVEKYNGSIAALYHAKNLSSNDNSQVGATIRFSLPVYFTK